ncbi:unnamed protein product [Anisakis simplex]|uniref:Uncharacterized protein n=1 Tax=Anisakis simplex TaxID=6269 RepID=A0A0M3J4V0_ANISI|nr:unnamed protein product [Anisakis simplex]
MNKVNNDAAHQAETSERRSISSPTTSTFMQRPIKTESYADNYDDMNFIRSLSHSNIDKSITGLDVSAMTDVDTSKHIPFNHRRSLGTTDQECANTSLDSPPGLSPIPIHTGAYSIDRFLNATEFYSEETEWNKWQQNETTQKQNSVDAMAQKYTHVYSEAFLQNESIPEVLGLIYADQGRGLLRYSYRMWSLNRLEIDPLKEVTCRLNWSLVVPSCLQNDANEDARIKNALRKYISNHIYNCRQTIVVRENRDELNRIKMLNLNKELLREAISRIVNKTSDEHGWTLYRPIPSYIMRNISGVRNKAYKQNKDLERGLF